MSFYSLPPEIHSIIFQFSDQSGLKALSLVSSYFLVLAQPLLYRVLYLPTRRQASSLSETLNQKPELAHHVRHILLADRITDLAYVVLPDFIIQWPQNQDERVARRQRIRDWLVEREFELHAFRGALHAIMLLVSRHIFTLTLLHYEHSLSTLHELLALPFPNLKELTLRGNYPPLPSTLDLPALERLHLAAGDMPNPWASFAAVASGCPRLTHLRISEPLSCILSGVVLANAMEVTFGYAEYTPEDLAMPRTYDKDGREIRAERPRLPPSLKCMLVQPYPAELTPMGLPYPDHQEMMARLKAIEEKCKVFSVLPPTADDYALPYCFEAAQAHWFDRVQCGGSGCW